ncbi:MAG: DUF4249 family protein [Flavobacteriales bacterium]|nr:DUF4249 family protein [Flavobacteriales bacterium]
MFNGGTKTMSLALEYHDLGNMLVRVNLYNISRELFFYNRSFELYNESYGNPFAQPVQVYSNIENGFGIFAGRNKSYKEISVEYPDLSNSFLSY